MRTIALLTLFISLTGISQHRINVLDADSGINITSALLKVKSIKNQQVYNFFPNEEGRFILEENFVGAVFEIDALGYETLRDTFKTTGNLEFKLAPIIQFDEVVVTAQYQPTTASRAVQKITVISSEQITNSGANNLSDVLNYQTGIRIVQDNVLGSTMNLEGISGENVKILIDGVPVIGRLNGNIDISQINLNNVERIEIIEGPLSVNYGTNALAGTINIITKKKPDSALDISLNPYYESIGNFNFAASAGVRIKEQNVHVSGGRNYFDGWSASDPFFQMPKSRLADTSRFKTWKPKEQYFGEVRYATDIKGWAFSPYVRHFDELIINRGYPLAPYQETAFDDYYHTRRSDIGATLQKSFKNSQLNIIGAYNDFNRIKNTYFKDLTTLGQTLSETPGAQDTSKFTLANIRVNYQFRGHKKLSFEVGTDINYESAYGVRIKDLEQFIGDYAGFATAQWKPSKNWIVKPGVRYAYNSVYEAPIIPSVNLKWQKKGLAVRGAVARGFRAPSLKELYFDFVDINHNIQGNTALKAEYSWNYSGYITWSKQLEKNSLLKFELGAFYNDMKDMITLGLTPDNSYTYINIGAYSTIGNQLGINYRTKRLQVNTRANYVGRYNALFDDGITANRYNWSPELSTTLNAFVIKDKLSVNAFYKFNGALQSFYINADDELTQRLQDSYSILDLSLTSFWLDKDLQIVVGAKNVLNVKDVNVIGSSGGVHSSSGNINAGRGISVFASAKYNLSYDFK